MQLPLQNHLSKGLKSLLVLLLSIVWGTSTQAQVYINEILADNGTVNPDPHYGLFVDWVELYNASNQWIDLGGWHLADQENPLDTWSFPPGTWIGPKAYLLVWADSKGAGLHLPFGLSSYGEWLVLFDGQKRKVDQIQFPPQYQNVSYGRSPDGGDQWGFMESPSPGISNPEDLSPGGLEIPFFSHTGGFYDAPINLELSSINPGDEIYFSTDGNDPLENGSLYQGPIQINSTRVVRAAIRSPSHIIGPVQTQTFFISEPANSLPVISLTTPPKNLWDNQIGIYVTGTNGIKGNGPETDPPRNWNQDWERPAYFEFYDADRLAAFQQTMGIKIFGGWSRAHAQKSLGVFPRKSYGKGSISYQLFEEKPISRFESIVLRNSGNDWATYGGSMFRDAFIHSLVAKQMDIDHQAYQPAVIFINGEYWGIQNIREKVNEHYLQNNHSADPKRVDLLEWNGSIIEGNNQAYRDMREYAINHDLSNPAYYQYVADRMDIQEYINYQLTQIYIDNKDWPGNNIKFWRSDLKGSKWRWILFDTDFGWGMWNESPAYNTLAFAREENGPGWPNPPWSTLLFRSLLKNESFKRQFIQDFQAHLYTTFKPERAIQIIDSLATRIAPEMPRHFQRWGGSMGSWNSAVYNMKTYAHQRPGYVLQHLKSGFYLQNPVELSIAAPDSRQGYVSLQGIRLQEDVTGGFFPDFPLKIEAQSKEGYRFLHWRKSIPGEETLIAAGDIWKFLDTGNYPGTNWTGPDYNDTQWGVGPAELGYGDGDEATVVSFGNSSQDKFTTTYFRKRITVQNKDSFTGLQLRIKRDDGAIVYLNGQEILRSNMPGNPVSYNTFALSGISGDGEDEWVSASVDLQLLQEGDNLLAVEIHQINPQSSDISFDMELKGWKDGGSVVIIPERIISYIPQYPAHLEAVFETGLSPQRVSNLFINEWMAVNDTHIRDEHDEYEDWVEIYNANDYPVDIGGLYISDNFRNLGKWQIPDTDPTKTSIAAKGFLRLWADKSPEQGVLHLSFGLSGQGEEIVLSEGARYIIDSVRFGPMSPDQSRGRYPDASDQWLIYSAGGATPSASNISFNQPPSFTSDPVTKGKILHQFSYLATATDPDGDPVKISATCLPLWLSVKDSGKGFVKLGGIPLKEDIGSYRIELVASDGYTGSESVQSFIIDLPHPVYQLQGSVLADQGRVFPNPTKGDFTYMRQVPPESEWHISVCDIQGRKVMSQRVKANSDVIRTSFNLAEKGAGLYILIAESPGFDPVHLKIQAY